MFQKARQELKDALRWYEEKAIGLGEDLKIEVSEKIKMILEYPNQYPITKSYYRETFT